METFEICRVCMDEVNHFWPLFDACQKVPPYVTPASLIAECAGVTIAPNDGLPDLVCESCLDEMVKAYTIRQKCISSDRKLRKILLRSSAVVEPQAVKLPEQVEEAAQDTEAFEAEPMRKSSAEEQDSSGSDVDVHEEGQEDTLKQEFFNEEYLIEYSKVQRDASEDEDQQITVDECSDGTQAENDHKQEEVIKAVEPIQLSEPHDKPIAPNDEDKKFVCTICQRRFTTKGNLKAHTQLHDNHKPFSCELCDATFAKKHNYNLHKQRHAGNRTHPCPVCEKRFVCAVNLKNHMQIHSAVKPFLCEYCGRGFSYRTDKIRHEASHTGQYRFGCGKCGRKFSRNTGVVKHEEKCNGQRTKQTASKIKTPKGEPTEQ